MITAMLQETINIMEVLASYFAANPVLATGLITAEGGVGFILGYAIKKIVKMVMCLAFIGVGAIGGAVYMGWINTQDIVDYVSNIAGVARSYVESHPEVVGQVVTWITAVYNIIPTLGGAAVGLLVGWKFG